MAKSIIIDDVNVAGCEFWKNYCRISALCDFPGHICDVNTNCYYKQLQHEKAENEQLKEDLAALQQTYNACELNKRYEQVHRAFHKQSVFIDNLQNVAKLNDYDKITEAIKEYYFSTSNDVDEKGG